MTQPDFQSFANRAHLDATIVSENVLRSSSIDATIFKCELLILCFFCLRLFQLVQDSAYSQTFKLWLIVVFFWMFHNKKLLRTSSNENLTFPEGPT